MTTEEKVAMFVKDVLALSSLHEAFCGFIVSPSIESRKEAQKKKLNIFWGDIQQDVQECAIKAYIGHIYSFQISVNVSMLFDILETMVEQNLVPAKLVCEVLLANDNLSPSDSRKWRETFRVIRNIVGGVDYKSCRDILRQLLEKTLAVPISRFPEPEDHFSCLYKVIEYILDRNACLLPSYFAVNEISKFFPEDSPSQHARLGLLLANFVQSFRPCAKMVVIACRSSLLPVVGYSSNGSNVWRLNGTTLRFTTNGPLPYDKSLFEPQKDMLRYILEQPYSRDMVSSMLNLSKSQKLRCPALEDLLVDLLVVAMERSEKDIELEKESEANHLLWQHLSSQVIFFVLFQFASFPHLVVAIYDKLRGRSLRKGRDHLMWVLLQFISGSIQKNPLADFLPVLQLFDLLYPENTALPVPDVTRPSSTHAMAVTCIWIHLCKKAQSTNQMLQRPTPVASSLHIEYLQSRRQATQANTMGDYTIALLCNAYSTNTDFFGVPMGVLIESIHGNGVNTIELPNQVQAQVPTEPLPMSLLDSLTVHAKMSLIHSIVTKVMRLAQSNGPVALAPAVVETYSRLLVYMEIESLGIKGFTSQLLPNVYKAKAWGLLHTLLEMFSYRLHHTLPHYRVQLLSYLNTLAPMPQTANNQLQICLDNTSLRLVTGLGVWEIQPQFMRVLAEPKVGLLVRDNEELNKCLILSLARSMHITGATDMLHAQWCKDLLANYIHISPEMNWSQHTLSCFPAPLAEFFTTNCRKKAKEDLATAVTNEYRKWHAVATEQDLMAQLSQPLPPYFFCVLWQSLLNDEKRIFPAAYKVLTHIGCRQLTSHIRVFCDYLVSEFTAIPNQGSQMYIDAVNDLVWKYFVVPLDRLLLCLALRFFDTNEAQVTMLIMQLILLRPAHFRDRTSPEHWKQTQFHEAHMDFYTKYPEKYFYEALTADGGSKADPYLPVYFANVCVRFLPVLDIIIHRYLEVPSACRHLDYILDHFRNLYKFHDRPATYLYTTLHYYEKKLRDRPNIRKALVKIIVSAFEGIRPSGWCVSEPFCSEWLLNANTSAENFWKPNMDYYCAIVKKMADIIGGKSSLMFTCDWRFNEFPNAAAHALHCSAIELMALPEEPVTVGHNLLNVILQRNTTARRDEVKFYINVVGLLLTALPDSYLEALYQRIVETFRNWPHGCHVDTFSFDQCFEVGGEQRHTYVLALAHSIWQHASIGQLSNLTAFLRHDIKSLIKSDDQLVYLCHLIGPFFQRLKEERTRCLIDLTVDLYEILEQVSLAQEHLPHMDSIVDFLYHIKYMFIGDVVKNDVERCIRKMNPALQLRLRFIAHHGKEEATSV